MVFPTDGVSGVMESVHAIPENVTKRVVAISIGSGVKAPEDSSELLNLKGLKVADLSCLDTSSTIRLASLFEGCSELLSVELGGIDTSKVQSVDHMFYACSSLTSLDLSSLDFRSVRVANALVSECYALADLRLPKTFGTELWGMDAMFAGDSRLSALDLSAVDMGAVAEARHVFRGVAGLVEWKVGKGFRPAVLDELPSSPDERGWWSVKDSRWYTNDQIKSQRSGMADTYRSKGEEKPVPEEKPQGQGSTPKNEGGKPADPKPSNPKQDSGKPADPKPQGKGGEQGKTPTKPSKPNNGGAAKPKADPKPNQNPKPSPKSGKQAVQAQAMHRLYNPNSGEHFYTASTGERDGLVRAGWRYEGVAWVAPTKSGTPVFRLYNKNAGDHHYTTSKAERDKLVSLGWRYEGIGWYSDDAKGQALFRLYNPNAKAGSHHYTVNAGERDGLVRLGWRNENVGWYGVKA